MKSSVEKRIAANEARYRAMAGTFVDAVWVIDAETCTFLYISPDTGKLRGYSHRETLGRNIRDVLTPDSYKKVKAIIEKAKADVEEHAGSTFSHTICPDCLPIYYPKMKS
ncbi:MAG: PAS domain S-box protein [Pseudomonadota bacterium]